MKRLLLLLTVVLCAFCVFSNSQDCVYAQAQSIKVITNYANVYDSTASDANVILVAKHKDKLQVESLDEIVGDNEIVYYRVVLQDYPNAYIRCHQVMLCSAINVSNLITPNASFRKKVSSVDLFTYTSSSYQKFLSIDVNPNIPIRIIDGYNRSKEFSQIQILIEDEIVNVYVKTKCIKPYGIPLWLKVVLYILGSLAVGVIITFITVKSKKILKGNPSKG